MHRFLLCVYIMHRHMIGVVQLYCTGTVLKVCQYTVLLALQTQRPPRPQSLRCLSSLARNLSITPPQNNTSKTADCIGSIVSFQHHDDEQEPNLRSLCDIGWHYRGHLFSPSGASYIVLGAMVFGVHLYLDGATHGPL